MGERSSVTAIQENKTCLLLCSLSPNWDIWVPPKSCVMCIRFSVHKCTWHRPKQYRIVCLNTCSRATCTTVMRNFCSSSSSIWKYLLEKCFKSAQIYRFIIYDIVYLQKAEAEPVGVQIVVKELEDVLIRDVGNRMSEDGRYRVEFLLSDCFYVMI